MEPPSAFLITRMATGNTVGLGLLLSSRLGEVIVQKSVSFSLPLIFFLKIRQRNNYFHEIKN